MPENIFKFLWSVKCQSLYWMNLILSLFFFWIGTCYSSSALVILLLSFSFVLGREERVCVCVGGDGNSWTNSESNSFFAVPQCNMQEGMEGNPVASTMKNVSRGLAVLTVPFTMSFPKVISYLLVAFCTYYTIIVYTSFFLFTSNTKNEYSNKWLHTSLHIKPGVPFSWRH